MIQAIQTEWDHLLGIASSSVPAPNHTLHSRIVSVDFHQFQIHMDLRVPHSLPTSPTRVRGQIVQHSRGSRSRVGLVLKCLFIADLSLHVPRSLAVFFSEPCRGNFEEGRLR